MEFKFKFKFRVSYWLNNADVEPFGATVVLEVPVTDEGIIEARLQAREVVMGATLFPNWGRLDWEKKVRWSDMSLGAKSWERVHEMVVSLINETTAKLRGVIETNKRREASKPDAWEVDAEI